MHSFGNTIKILRNKLHNFYSFFICIYHHVVMATPCVAMET